MVTLNTAIRNAQIQEGTITYKHFDATNTPSGSYIIKWNSDEDKFEWIPNGGITVNEAPSGSINGVNKTFTLSQTPIEGTEQVYLNGLLQEPGSSNDYTISGSTITFVEAPETNDILLVTYVTAQAFDYEEYTTPPMAGYGYTAGGYDQSTIDRFQFPFDSGTATHVGNLSQAVDGTPAGANSSTHGYIMGGTDEVTSNNLSSIWRMAFPFDSGTVNTVGNLSQSKYYNAGCNNSTYAYVLGGYEGSDAFTTIDRLQFPFDSGTASAVGNLSQRSSNKASCNATNYGYSLGGFYHESGFNWPSISNIERIQFPFNSGTASHVGNLSGTRMSSGGANSSNYGYCLAGQNGQGGSSLSIIDRIQFPFDSGTASHVGNASTARHYTAGCNATTYGYISGGGSPVSTIDRFQFPFNSGTATHVGNLSTTRSDMAGIDNIDFVSMFV